MLVPKRDGLIEHLNNRDIFPGVHYVPNTEYEMYSYAKGTCKHADYVGDHVLSLPMHMRLTEKDLSYVCSCIKEYVIDNNSETKLDWPEDWD